MMKAWKNEIAKAGFLLIIVLILFFAFLIPGIDALTKNKETLDQKKVELINAQNKAQKLKEADKNRVEITKTADNISKLWPKQMEVSEFIVFTEKLAEENKLVIDNLTIDQPKVIEKAKTTPKTSDKDSKSKTAEEETPKTVKKTDTGIKFSIAANSSFDNINKLISGMESLPRFNIISTLNLTLNSSDNTISTKASGYIYYGE